MRPAKYYQQQAERYAARSHRATARSYMAELRNALAGGGVSATRSETVWHYATLVQFYRELARNAMARAS